MKKFRFISFLFLIIISLGILCSCGGEQGPVGPQGEQGIQGAQGEQGQPGKDGINGKDGASLLTGNGEPTNVIGIVGDSYIDLDTWNFYIKSNNGWTLEGNIKGKDGNNTLVDYVGTDGLDFYPINDTECAITVGTANLLEEIIIPSKYKNYTITTIHNEGIGMITVGGFANCKNLKKITLPDTITTIKHTTFFNCVSLTSIVIPKGVITIEEDVFKNCSLLTIYCEAEFQPSGWYLNWNWDRPVYWAGQWEYDSNGNPVPLS